MPSFSIFKVFAILGVVSAWANKALEDGKISVQEGIGLVVDMAPVLGIPLEWDVPEAVLEATEDIRQAHETLVVDDADANAEVVAAGLKQ